MLSEALTDKKVFAVPWGMEDRSYGPIEPMGDVIYASTRGITKVASTILTTLKTLEFQHAVWAAKRNASAQAIEAKEMLLAGVIHVDRILAMAARVPCNHPQLRIEMIMELYVEIQQLLQSREKFNQILKFLISNLGKEPDWACRKTSNKCPLEMISQIPIVKATCGAHSCEIAHQIGTAMFGFEREFKEMTFLITTLKVQLAWPTLAGQMLPSNVQSGQMLPSNVQPGLLLPSNVQPRQKLPSNFRPGLN